MASLSPGSDSSGTTDPSDHSNLVDLSDGRPHLPDININPEAPKMSEGNAQAMDTNKMLHKVGQASYLLERHLCCLKIKTNIHGTFTFPPFHQLFWDSSTSSRTLDENCELQWGPVIPWIVTLIRGFG